MNQRTLATEDVMPKPMTTPLSVEIVTFIEAQHNLRPKTKKEYLASLSRFAQWSGDGTLRDLNPKLVNAYVTLKVEAGHPYLARNDMATLRVFAKWLVQAKHLRENPLVSVAVPKVSQKGRPPFTDAEVDRIFRAAEDARYPAIVARDKLVLMLALWCGLRLNELRTIQWPQDIDLREEMLYVRASKTDAGIRQVRLSPRMQAEISAYVRSYRAWGEQPGPLFLNVNSEPFTYHAFARVQGRIRSRLKGTGIDYKIHRMRNTWASATRANGVDVLDIQQMGGWTDLSMVRRYAGNKSSAELRRLPTLDGVFGRAV